MQISLILNAFGIACIPFPDIIAYKEKYSNDIDLLNFQPVVQQSTSCPSGSTALRSQTWLRKIDARSCVELVITEYIDRSHVWLRNDLEPVGQIVDCCTTGWNPSFEIICILFH